MNPKYAICASTTAELIKMMPILKEFDKREIPYIFISTGQHDISKIIKSFSLRSPDVIINPRDGFRGDTGLAIGWSLNTLFKAINYLRKQKNIEYVIVHGDTASSFIFSTASRIAFKKVVHVEAGLRSGNIFLPFPEEISRQGIDFLSDIKFAVSEKTKNRLRGKVYNVGNTSAESLKIALDLNNVPNLKLPGVFAIASIHRHEAFKDKEKMENIVNIVLSSPIPVLWPMHKNTEKILNDYGLLYKLKTDGLGKIRIEEPMEYSQFVQILKNAQFVIGDGGSLAEELSYLNIPYCCCRSESEREELLNRWDQQLVGFDISRAKEVIKDFSQTRKKYSIPSIYYNKNGTSKQIVNILEGFK